MRGVTSCLTFCAFCVFLLNIQFSFAATVCGSDPEESLQRILFGEFGKSVDLNELRYFFTNCPGVKLDGLTLRLGLQWNNTEIIKILIKNGADYRNDHLTLIVALEQNNMEILKILLAYGVDFKEFPWDAAVRQNSTELIKLLIDHGADIRDPEFPLSTAVKQNNPELLKLIFANGAVIHDNWWVMLKALERNNPELLNILFANGGYLEHDYYTYDSAMEQISNPKIYRIVIQHKIYAPSTDTRRKEAQYNAELLKILMDNGANAPFSRPTWNAILKKNSTHLLEVFLAKGADVRSDEFPMDTALDQNNPKLLRLIFNHGADRKRFNSRAQAVFKEGNIAEILKVLVDNFKSPQKAEQIRTWIFAQNRTELIEALAYSPAVPDEFLLFRDM